MSILVDLIGPRRTFEGGLSLLDHKSVTARRPIERVGADGPLHIPLQLRRDTSFTLEVEIGERVAGGAPLARPAGSEGVPVFAPTSGTVTATGRVWTPFEGFVPCVTLEPDGQDAWPPAPARWAEESFMGQLWRNGVLCPRTRRAATEILLEAAQAGVDTVIVSAMETEPYLSADLRTLVEDSARVVDAACEFADALGARRLIFALPYRHRRVLRRVQGDAAGRYIEVAPLADKYPQCHPVVLTKTLLDLEVPPGGRVVDVGVLVLSLALCRRAAEALFEDRPVTHSLVTVSGDVVEHPGVYRVPVGTPVERLLRRAGTTGPVSQMICGGPLTGVEIERLDAVVTSDMMGLLLFGAADRPAAAPCIRCGWCVEDCPTGLDPVNLMHLEARSRCDAAELAQLQACIDCGLCSHVCPSQLPLAQTIARSRERFLRA